MQNIDKFRKTRVKLIQEEYAELLGEPSFKYEVEEFDKERYRTIKKVLAKHRNEIDELIQKYSPKRPLESLNKPDHAVLRVAIAETFYAKAVPVKVGINEAVELAKRFGTDQSYRFVNGVLGNILRNEFPELLESE